MAQWCQLSSSYLELHELLLSSLYCISGMRSVYLLQEEERNRVDALKSCLEQERQKYDKLAEQMQHQHTQPLPLLTLTPAKLV